MKRNIITILFLMCITVFVVFSQAEAIINDFPCYEPNYTPEQIEKFKSKVINEGNVNSYEALYFLSPSYERLPYSLIMANKYNYPTAYYDVYIEMSKMYSDLGLQMDSITTCFCMRYLIKAADMGNRFASFSLSEKYLYGLSIQRDTIKSKTYLFKSLSHRTDQQKDRTWRIMVREYNKKNKK